MSQSTLSLILFGLLVFSGLTVQAIQAPISDKPDCVNQSEEFSEDYFEMLAYWPELGVCRKSVNLEITYANPESIALPELNRETRGIQSAISAWQPGDWVENTDGSTTMVKPACYVSSEYITEDGIHLDFYCYGYKTEQLRDLNMVEFARKQLAPLTQGKIEFGYHAMPSGAAVHN